MGQGSTWVPWPRQATYSWDNKSRYRKGIWQLLLASLQIFLHDITLWFMKTLLNLLITSVCSISRGVVSCSCLPSATWRETCAGPGGTHPSSSIEPVHYKQELLQPGTEDARESRGSPAKSRPHQTHFLLVVSRNQVFLHQIQQKRKERKKEEREGERVVWPRWLSSPPPTGALKLPQLTEKLSATTWRLPEKISHN